jgi:hypothetical protein
MKKINNCQFLGKQIEHGWECGLGYWDGVTGKRYCELCQLHKRDNLQYHQKFLENPNIWWKDFNGSLRPVQGLGDVVHNIAQPIAKTIDKILGTNIKGCGGCKKRQKKLNQLFPISQFSA